MSHRRDIGRERIRQSTEIAVESETASDDLLFAERLNPLTRSQLCGRESTRWLLIPEAGSGHHGRLRRNEGGDRLINVPTGIDRELRRRLLQYVRPNTLYCFSPPVMLITFVTELVLAAIVFARSGRIRFGQAATLALLLLAVFQLVEFQICANASATILWARIGFAVVTLLPLLGLYLVSLVSHKTHFLRLGYVAAIGFCAYFLVVPKSITGAVCGGNYVTFDTAQDAYWLFGLYYLGFLLLGIWEAVERIAELKRGSAARGTLYWMIVAYASFMLPMGVVYFAYPETRSAVASIMCGFALIMAFILAMKIVPRYMETHPAGAPASASPPGSKQ
jgi:hypothetical protein